jgi:thioredoxin-dependent peroxiredoxin
MLEAGMRAPEFTLKDAQGKTVKLSDFIGTKVVLYFYPKDDTPGCTTQACGFRDLHESFQTQGAVVLGVSPDGDLSHQKFIEKFQLPFVLLSDPDHVVATSYGAYGEKNMYGKITVGIIRKTFILDAQHTIHKAYHRVKTAGHAEQVLSVIQAI